MTMFSRWVDRTFGGGTPANPSPEPEARATALPPVPPPTPLASPVYAPRAEFERLMMIREGVRYEVYRDSRGLPTVGIGHLVTPGDNLAVGDRITQARVDVLFEVDGSRAFDAAIEQCIEAGINDPTFLPYLASVNFQIGTAWPKNFPNTWRLICAGFYESAAANLNGSAWRQQTPTRVVDFQQALKRLPKKDLGA